MERSDCSRDGDAVGGDLKGSGTRLECAIVQHGPDHPPATLVEALEAHACTDEEERRDRDHILDFVRRHADPFDRRIPEGHLTGSAIVVSPAGGEVLLLHHRKLDRWLQPGGHADPGETRGEQVALRECLEETGLRGLRLHPSAPRPLDVDVHDIPARGDEPAHEHLDLRYLVVAPVGADALLTPQLAELRALRWVAWDDASALDPDRGLRRALGKARAVIENGPLCLRIGGQDGRTDSFS